MGGGLTILPNIAERYQLKVPEQPTATESIGGLMKLKGQMAENALKSAQQEHVQAQTQQLNQAAEMQQRNLDDQKTIANYFQEAQTDPDKAKAFGNGDFSGIIGQLKNPANADILTTHHAAAVKNIISLGEAKRKEAGEKESKLFDVLDSASAVPEDQRVDAFNSGVDNAVKQGLIDPNVVPRATSLKDLDAIAAGHSMRSRLIETADKRAKAEAENQKLGAEVADKTADQQKKQLEAKQLERQQIASRLASAAAQGPEALQAVVAGLPPEHQQLFSGVSNPKAILRLAMTPEQITQSDRNDAELARQNAVAQETARHNRTDESLSGGRLSAERSRLALEQQKAGFEMNGGVSPIAQSLVNGDYDGETGRAILRKNPGLMAQAKSIDPNFDQNQLDKKSEVRKEFSSSSNGKAGGQVIAFNTAIHHADLWLQAQDALKNGSFQPGNALYNKFVDTFGSANVNDSKIVARALAGEINKATSGVQAEGEMKGTMDTLNSNASPEKSTGAVKTMIGLMAGKLSALNEKVQDAKLGNIVHVLGPEAKEILARRGFNPDTMKPVATIRARDAQGKLHEAPAGTKLPDGWKLEP